MEEATTKSCWLPVTIFAQEGTQSVMQAMGEEGDAIFSG